MSKTLTLIRHGKSSWEFDLDDHDRPITKRAYEDIKLLAKHAKSQFASKSYFFSSSANRAQTTAKLLMEYIDIEQDKLTILSELYTFDHKTLKEIIFSLDNNINDAVIFGHNPAFTILANYFGDEQFLNIPTSGLVKLNFENTNWKDCRKARTILHLFPKNLR